MEGLKLAWAGPAQIELAVIRESMGRLGSQIRWIPHPRMLVDQMTKLPKAAGSINMVLTRFMLNPVFRLIDEASEMSERASDATLKHRTKASCERALQDLP